MLYEWSAGRRFTWNIKLAFGDVSVLQLVASMSSVVLSGVVQAVGSNLARGKIFRVSIGSALHIYICSLIRTFFSQLGLLEML